MDIGFTQIPVEVDREFTFLVIFADVIGLSLQLFLLDLFFILVVNKDRFEEGKGDSSFVDSSKLQFFFGVEFEVDDPLQKKLPHF